MSRSRSRAWPASAHARAGSLIGAAFVVLAILGQAQWAHGTERRVVLGVPADVVGEANRAELLLAVQAHLSSLDVVIELALLEETEGGDVAMGGATERSALCVAWLSPDLASLTLMTPTLGNQVRVRQLPSDDEGWLSRCDVIATVLHSELGALITPVSTEAPPAEPEEPRARVVSAVLLSVLWDPYVMSSDGPFLQGVAVGIGIELARRVTFRASMGLVEPVALELGDAKLGRWPGRISVAVLLPRERLELELEIGVLLDVWKVLALGYEPADASAGQAHLDAAVAPAGRVRYRVAPWLAPFVEVGADIYPQRRTFAMGDEPLVGRDPALLRVGVGVTFLLETR